MGNVITKRNFLISTAVTFSCLTLYKLASRLFKKDNKFLEELKDIGIVQVQHNRCVSPNKLLKILYLLHKYSYEYTKESKEYNQGQREELLKRLDYESYILAVINDYVLTIKVEEQIKNYIYDELGINQEILQASINRYQEETKREEIRHMEYILRSERNVTEEEIENIIKEKLILKDTLKGEINIQEKHKRRCIKVFGNNWEDIVKDYIIGDILYEKYKISMKVIEANYNKLKIIT